jgi:hypothetical protein
MSPQFPDFHAITKRSNNTAALRAMQDAMNHRFIGRTLGVAITRTTRGTFVRPLARNSTEEGGGGAAYYVPVWG